MIFLGVSQRLLFSCLYNVYIEEKKWRFGWMSPKRDNDDNKQLTRKDRATQPMDHGRLSNMKKKTSDADRLAITQ